MIDVRDLRRRLGLTQAQLADRLGTDQSTVSRLETGQLAPRGPIGILLRQLAEEAAHLPDPGETPSTAEKAA
jgi:transcriptional regulator with XRE-family HTH domain